MEDVWYPGKPGCSECPKRPKDSCKVCFGTGLICEPMEFFTPEELLAEVKQLKVRLEDTHGALKQGMKMEMPKKEERGGVTIAPPKILKELVKQLVESRCELPKAQSTLDEAEQRFTRVEAEGDRAIDQIKANPPDVPHAYLVKTRVATKVVLVTSIKGEIDVQVFDVEEI